MCWTSREKVASKIATTDIPIVKFVVKTPIGFNAIFYRAFEYKLDEVYTTELDSIRYGLCDYVIYKGFHSYAQSLCQVSLTDKEVSIKGANYWDYNYFITSSVPNIVIAKGVIPAGSTYYMNAHGECVSDKIKLTDIFGIVVKKGNKYVLEKLRTTSQTSSEEKDSSV